MTPQVTQVFPVLCAKNSENPSCETAAETPSRWGSESFSNNSDRLIRTLDDADDPSLVLEPGDDLELEIARFTSRVVWELDLKTKEPALHTANQVR